MANLILMVGIPGAGKSTWCKNHLSDNAVYISRDIIRYDMVPLGAEYFSKENQVFKEFTNQINNALKTGKDVFADQTSINKASRAKILKQVGSNASKIIAVWINSTIKTALKQNAQRDGIKRVPEDGIRNMYNCMEEPTLNEGFTDIYIIEPEYNLITHKFTYKEGE